MRISLALAFLTAAVLPACSAGDPGATEDGDALGDGAPGNGGSSNPIGSVGSGGSSSTGSAGTPGIVQGGGSAGTGVSAGSGGAKGTGGQPGSGGAQGTSGAAGSGGSMVINKDAGPHTIGKCDSLGPVGQWENITPPGVTLDPPYTGALTVLPNPQVGGTVYLMTSKSGVFKSKDCGATWAKTNTGKNGKELDSGLIWSAVIDPITPDTIYALTGYGPAGLWKSTNGGVDWDQTVPTGIGMPGFVARVNMDPTNPQHLIINFHDNCTGGHAPVCFGETKDGAATWKVLDFPPSIKSGWGEGTAVMPLDATHWIYTNWELYYTADAGATWKEVTPPNGAASDVSYFQTTDGTFYLGAANGVMSSRDGAAWTMIQNSGHSVDAVVGDGTRLFAIEGFQPPSGNPFAWSATYNDPTHWSVLTTPAMSAGSNGGSYDSDHHILYTANQGAGMWRVVTK